MSAIDPTCLPWQTVHDFDTEGSTTIIGNVDGEIIDGTTHHTYDFVARTLNLEDDSQSHSVAIANAAFIVRACNAYPSLLNGLREARDRLAAIVGFGDPWEIIEEPEEFGGTDDGQETVCMVYENMQGIARGALAKLDALLSQEGQS